MSKFNLRLRELRTSRKLSQQDLADYLNISKSSVNMYERGEREPGLDTLEAIADFFNVDLDYLSGKTSEIKTFAIDKSVQYKLSPNVRRIMDNIVILNDDGLEALADYSDFLKAQTKFKKVLSDKDAREA